MIRVLCLIGGLAGAASLSQLPEFSQQYLQRLAGQVEALTIVVKEFDAAALAEGMGREEALEDLSASEFQISHQANMRAMFTRHARLSENLMILRAASPLQRLTLVQRMSDGPTVQAVWDDFTPAMPVSMAGAASAGAGFLGGWAFFAVVFGILAAPFRKRSSKTAPQTKRRERGTRVDPPVARPNHGADPAKRVPKLSGVQR